jgi:RNA polymerase sigma factor (sigma-70 family)
MGPKSAPHHDGQLLPYAGKSVEQVAYCGAQSVMAEARTVIRDRDAGGPADAALTPPTRMQTGQGPATATVPSLVVAAMDAPTTPLGPTEELERVLLQLTPGEQQYVKRAATDPRWRSRLLQLPVQNVVATIRDEIVHREQEQQRIDQFLRRELQWFHVMAGRMAGWADAEDVVQDACIHLLKCIRRMPRSESAKTLTSDGALRALMSTITSRRAFDFLRKKQRKKEHVTADGASLERGDDGSVQRSQAALDVDRLERAYRAMRPIQRIVHVLHHFYEFTARDCAKTLHLTESNVETLIYRATKMLKYAMETKP